MGTRKLCNIACHRAAHHAQHVLQVRQGRARGHERGCARAHVSVCVHLWHTNAAHSLQQISACSNWVPYKLKAYLSFMLPISSRVRCAACCTRCAWPKDALELLSRIVGHGNKLLRSGWLGNLLLCLNHLGPYQVVLLLVRIVAVLRLHRYGDSAAAGVL